MVRLILVCNSAIQKQNSKEKKKLSRKLRCLHAIFVVIKLQIVKLVKIKHLENFMTKIKVNTSVSLLKQNLKTEQQLKNTT